MSKRLFCIICNFFAHFIFAVKTQIFLFIPQLAVSAYVDWSHSNIEKFAKKLANSLFWGIVNLETFRLNIFKKSRNLQININIL